MRLNTLKSKLRLMRYTKITALVLLMSFLKFPMYAEQPTEQATNLSESETRFYSDLEVECLAELDQLIDDLTVIALEAIEQAAGEAARAAFLQSLEREAEAIREAQKWRSEAEMLKRVGIRNAVISGIVCFAGGLIIGILIK